MLLLIGLNWMYNDLGGADECYIIRNLIISVAYACYGSGALRITGGGDFVWSSMTYQWIAMASAVIFTLMQVQDLKDQEEIVPARERMPPWFGVTKWPGYPLQHR